MKEVVQMNLFNSCQLYIALDQRYIDGQVFEHLSERLSHIAGMISNLMNYLRRSNVRGTKYKRET